MGRCKAISSCSELISNAHVSLWLHPRHGLEERGSARLTDGTPSKILTCTCGWWTSRPHIVSKCNASMSLFATVGEEPEVEVALV